MTEIKETAATQVYRERRSLKDFYWIGLCRCVSCLFCVACALGVDRGVGMIFIWLDYWVACLFVDMGIELGEVAFLVWMHLNIGECIPWMDAFDIVGSVFSLSHITHCCITHC